VPGANSPERARVAANEILLTEAIRKFVNIIKDNSYIKIIQPKENAIYT